jgi:hypothetical protein
MAGRLTSRLDEVERRLRPAALSGITDVLVTVPRSQVASLGEQCAVHPVCSVRRLGAVTTHFLTGQGYDR